jgi:3-oxoacyl-[acyl-carrier protein] reductase
MINPPNMKFLFRGVLRAIGRACTSALEKVGTRARVHNGRAADEVYALVSQIKSGGSRRHAVAADIPTAMGRQKFAFDEPRIVGDRRDMPVASVRISKLALVEEMTIRDFDRSFAVKVRAPHILVQQVLPSPGAGSRTGSLSSPAVHAALSKNLSAYATTKEAADIVARYFTFILGQHGIHVNGVFPSVVEIDFTFVRIDAVCRFAASIRASSESLPTTSPDVVTFASAELRPFPVQKISSS